MVGRLNRTKVNIWPYNCISVFSAPIGMEQSPIPPTSKMQDLTSKIHKTYNKIINKIKHEDEQDGQYKISNKHIIGGGLLGIILSAFIRWNMGKYSRLGIYRKRWALARNFIMINQRLPFQKILTNYYAPNLDIVARNFMCYSGEAGIGKSTHFMNLAYSQSIRRPSLYLSFKFSGKDHNTFEQDIAQQVGYGENSPGILSEIIRATKKIHDINKNPHKLWLKIMLTHLGLAFGVYKIAVSDLDATYGIALFSLMGVGYALYLHFIYPFIIQSLRRTCPVIIFDDLNKIQQLNMFPEIVRYLQVLESGMANVILISPDEDTWCKLRREPGVKDRLRVRQIFYNHLYTAETLLKYISEDKNFETYMKYINGNPLYTKNIVISLVKELIGKRQVTLRRFTSILILNDEEEYEKLVGVLRDHAGEKINTGEAVQQFTDILYESEAKTMVANLKSIKREIKLTEQKFVHQLRTLLEKRKLPSDNMIAPHLKAYNIVRDMQSDFIFNGRFMFTVFSIAIKQYEKDLKQYNEDSDKKPQALGSIASQGPEPVLKSETGTAVNIKDWNSSNTVQKPLQSKL